MLNFLLSRLNEQQAKKQRSNPSANTKKTTSPLTTNFDKDFDEHLNQKYSPSVEPDSIDSPELETIDSLASGKEQNYVLTKSLYAQRKQVDIGPEQVDSLENEANANPKVITALSINEIETRKSWCVDEMGDTSEDGDGTEMEKSSKEEFVLIGEKCNIDSLLDNKNNQLYNLIMSNSSRSSKLDEIETNLGQERVQQLQHERSEVSLILLFFNS